MTPTTAYCRSSSQPRSYIGPDSCRCWLRSRGARSSGVAIGKHRARPGPVGRQAAFLVGILRDPVVLCCASWCQLQRAPRGKLLKRLIMPRSRVRVPLSPPVKASTGLSARARTIAKSRRGRTGGGGRKEIENQRGALLTVITLLHCLHVMLEHQGDSAADQELNSRIEAAIKWASLPEITAMLLDRTRAVLDALVRFPSPAPKLRSGIPVMWRQKLMRFLQ